MLVNIIRSNETLVIIKHQKLDELSKNLDVSILEFSLN